MLVFLKKRSIIILLLILSPILPLNIWATTVHVLSPEENKIDQLYLAAQSVQTRSEAIQGLKGFIEDKGMPFHIKRYATRKLGELHLPELEDYFLEISSKKRVADDKQMPWDDTYQAYWKIRVNHEPDPEKQVAMLTEVLQAELEGRRAGKVRWWASVELCNRGIQSAFPAIVESIKSRVSGSDAEKEINLCRMQIKALSDHPTRFEALVAALKEGDPTRSSIDLKNWAVKELASMKIEEANKVLANYALHLQEIGAKLFKEGNSDLQPYSSVHSYIFYSLRENGWENEQLQKYGIKDFGVAVVIK